MIRWIASAFFIPVTLLLLLLVSGPAQAVEFQYPEGVIPAFPTGWGQAFYLRYRENLPEESRFLKHANAQELAEHSCEGLGGTLNGMSGINPWSSQVGITCDLSAVGGRAEQDVGHLGRTWVCPEGWGLSIRRDSAGKSRWGCFPKHAKQENLGTETYADCGVCPLHADSNPINIATGNKFQRETLYANPGNPLLRLELFYNSHGSKSLAQQVLSIEQVGDPNAHHIEVFGYDQNTVSGVSEVTRSGSVGRRWTHFYNRRLLILPDVAIPSLIAMRHDGAAHFFTHDGSWSPKYSTRITIEAADKAKYPDARYVLKNTSGQLEYYDRSGNLMAIHQAGGRHVELQYADNGQLIAVQGDRGRRIEFLQDDDGLIVSAKDTAGSTYRFLQGDSKELIEVSFPDNTSRKFSYTTASNRSNRNFLLSSITDESGNRYARWEYDSVGRAILSEHAEGSERFSVEYLPFTTAKTINAAGNEQNTRFDQHGAALQLSWSNGGKCANCDRDIASASYDGNGFPVRIIEGDGSETAYSHDTRGLETSRTEAVGTPEQRTITTEWHPDFRLPTRITEPGRVTEHHYDANGNRLTTTITDTATGESRTTSWTYNDYGQVLTVDGPRNDVSDVTTHTYDAQGNVSTITNALGHQTQYTDYDAHGNPLRIVDANGVVTELEYDLRQRLTSRTVAAGTANAVTTSFTYDPVGQLIETVLPNGSSIRYDYDAAHRLVAIEDNIGNRIDYTLDAMGNRINETVSGPGGNVLRETSREYNTLNRLVASIGGEGQRTTYTYDADGNRTGVTDAQGNATTNRYDALDRLFETVDALGGVTRYQYDPKDNLAQVIDPRGVTTGYSYNGFNELVETVSPDAGTTIYTYDKAGNRISQTDARGITVHYQYDALNRLVVIDYPEPVDGSPSKDITYTYDDGTNGIGRLSRIDDETGSTDYYYGPRGNLVSKVSIVDGVTLPVDYSYDAADNIATQRYPSGATVEYQRDTAGRVTGLDLVQVDGSRVALLSGIGYAPFGPITGMSYGNGITETRTFDRDGRITNIQSHVQDLGYTWSATNNITGIADNLDSTKSQNFSYDALYRLTTATGAYGNLDWQYDAVGNRTAQADDGTLTNYSYESLSNRLAAIDGPDGNISYLYDETGNTLSDGDSSYSYDARNRLTTAVIPAEAGTRYEYAHNALGQRVTKPRFQTAAPGDADGDGVINENDLHALRDIIKGRSPATDGADCNQDGNIDNKDVSCIAQQIGNGKNNGKKNRSPVHAEREPGQTFNTTSTSGTNTIAGNILFAYDEAGHLIGEYDETGAVIREYIWLGDRPVAMIESSGSIHYIHSDHLNTPKVVTDQSQVVVWKGNYSPFGEVEEAVSTIEFNLRYPGQYYDAETGLNYNYFRSYNPATGRYTQSDPIGLRGGVNSYAYVAASPIKNIDPLGLAYFAKRALDGFPWLGWMSHSTWGPDNSANTEISHEQLFFEDGKSPQNVGLGPDGLFTETQPVGYTKTDGGYDDCIMRIAVEKAPVGEYCLLGITGQKNNCQDWADRVRAYYDRLKDDPEVTKKCDTCE